MIANINAAAITCGMNLLVHSISTNRGDSANKKAYYQHRHPCFEVHYIVAGQCKAICNGKSYTLDSETIFLVPPGVYHDVLLTSTDTLRLCISFSLQKNKEILSDAKSNTFYSIFDQNIPIATNLHNSEAQMILNRVCQLLEHKEDTYRNEKLLTLCTSLLLELIPHITDTPSDTHPIDTCLEQKDVNFKIDDFLGTNFMCNNAKSRMASELYISPRQLQRIMQKNYGMSYRQKLSETRVQIAVDLLCNTDMQIHKIAEILGYSCSANFSAFIKRATGKTPSQIRKEQ